MTLNTWQIAGVAFFASFGGAAIEHFAAAVPVHAQELPHTKTITAETLVLVDPSGARRAVLSASAKGGALVLMDARGRRRVELDGRGHVSVYDQQQQLVWKVPEGMRILPLSE